MRGLLASTFLAMLSLIPQVGNAASVRLTIYDDGRSCPHGCDAHVVFHSSLNGTEHAHDPKTIQAPYSKCRLGEACHLCIESGGRQCLTATYRGGGPSPMTFDFTPTFYKQACKVVPEQAALATQCAALKKAEQGLSGRINCIAEPNRPECELLVASAKKRQDSDRPDFESCLAKGETEFNKTVPKERQRALTCAYEKFATGGPNSKGTTWRRLLPAACRAGTYVGRDELDCCSGNTFSDGPLGRECRTFYPK